MISKTLLAKQNFDLIILMSISLFDTREHINTMKNCENIIWIEIEYKSFYESFMMVKSVHLYNIETYEFMS